MFDDEDEEVVTKRKSDPPPPRRRAKKLHIPRRAPSVVIPPRELVYITPDKTTCKECPCFPKEDPYVKPKVGWYIIPRKLSPCQMSPLTLYELAAEVVDGLRFPKAFAWSEEEVAEWMAEEVGFPDYKECIFDNHINGLRLLMLEDPSKLAEINIRDFEHIQRITAKVRELYSTEFIRFARSIGLPPRKPLTHCTWFKSRTGPTWGIRQNWSRSDILRWMKILMPKPIYLDHWDLVWYHKPDFPKVLFARLKTKPASQVYIPHYFPPRKETCREYTAPRKFRLLKNIPEENQYIWLEHRPGSPIESEWHKREREKREAEERKKRRPQTIPKKSRLDPPKINLTGLKGDALLLARRKMPRKKFMPQTKKR